MSSIFKSFIDGLGTGMSGGETSSVLTLAPDLEQRVRDAPGCREVLREVIDATGADDRALLSYFSSLAQSDPRHDLSLARLFATKEKGMLAVVHYRKYLASYPSTEIYEELAAVYDTLDKPEKAREIREQHR